MSDLGAFALRLTERARDDLKKLDKTTAEKIVKKLRWLAENADSITHSMLSGQWRGLLRIRVGSYRVLYTIDHEERVIVVALIGHRRDIYDG